MTREEAKKWALDFFLPEIHSGYGMNLRAESRARLSEVIDALTQPAPVEQPRATATETGDRVEWVVNDIAELGVRVDGEFYWYYKRSSPLVYAKGMHATGQPMLWRPVDYREFGECIHPIHLKRLPERYTEGEGWKPIVPVEQPTTPLPALKGDPCACCDKQATHLGSDKYLRCEEHRIDFDVAPVEQPAPAKCAWCDGKGVVPHFTDTAGDIRAKRCPSCQSSRP